MWPSIIAVVGTLLGGLSPEPGSPRFRDFRPSVAGQDQA